MPAERSALRRLAALFALIAVALAAPVAARADGGVGYRVDGEPGSRIEGGFIRLPGAPGSTVSGYFFATNSGAQDANLTVYAADGLTGDTTGIVYSDLGDALDDAGTWISPSSRGMVLGKGGDRRIDFSVRVPAGASAGDHVGGIVLEQRRSGSTISQVVRNVVPVLIDVTGSANSAMALRSAQVTDLPGTTLPAVTVRMANTGGRICRPTLTVALTGPGERGSPITRNLDAILPGDSVPFPLPWPRTLARGTYTAAVTASGCGANVSLRTEVRSDTNAETDAPSGTKTNKPDVVTKAAPGPPEYTSAPRYGAGDGNGDDGKDDRGRNENGAGDGTGTESTDASGGVPPAGTGGSGSGSSKGGSGSAGAGGGSSIGAKFGQLGDVAIKYLPPLLERLIAPLSLLGLMLLFLFAQETFDRKDPKLALAPIQRDPDLEFEPLGEEFRVSPGPEPELSVVRPLAGPEPLPS
ncbi:MAG: hypothetical protein PGN13_07120 [Patulibacter minatonensis]